MAKVPEGGYQADQIIDDGTDKKKKVMDALNEFDKSYSKMMNQLQEAWTTNPGALGVAVGTMFSLRDSAQKLMAIPILEDESTGTYGPCFRYISSS